MVIVDTSVWTVALRQSSVSYPAVRNTLATLIRQHGIVMMGPIRQELLSGIGDKKQFSRLQKELSHFSDLEILQQDYEEAAICFNKCRSRGIQGSNTDFLICAVSLRKHYPILTTDRDFKNFARVLNIRLFELQE